MDRAVQVATNRVLNELILLESAIRRSRLEVERILDQYAEPAPPTQLELVFRGDDAATL